MDRSSSSNRSTRQSSNNPSLGLGVWGPLVPANDCKKCLASLAVLQLGAGALLWLKPGRRPPPTRGVWTNRLVKLGGALGGTYLVFMAGIEFARLALPYDPWVEDARVARKNSAEFSTLSSKSMWNPLTWRFQWFGPSDYRAVPWSDWQQRTTAYLERAEKAKPQFDKLQEMRDTLATHNRSISAKILTQIQLNQLPAPEVPVQELEALSMLPDVGDEQEFYDEIDLRNADLWEFFEETQVFSVIIVPRSTEAFLPGVKIANEDGLKSQNVNYMPIPLAIKNKLR